MKRTAKALFWIGGVMVGVWFVCYGVVLFWATYLMTFDPAQYAAPLPDWMNKAGGVMSMTAVLGGFVVLVALAISVVADRRS